MKTRTANATAAIATSKPTSREPRSRRRLADTGLALRVRLGTHLVAGRVDDQVLAEQVIARGIRLGNRADQLRLELSIVGVDGGDAVLRIRVDDRERAVQLREERIERDDRGVEILLVAVERGIEVAHHIAKVG